MLNNGCVPSQSGPTEVTADFRFTRVMAEQAARAEWAYLADAEKEAQGN